MLVCLGSLDPPDQRLDSLELTKVEWVLASVAVIPVVQQLAGNDSDSRPAFIAPLIHTRPNHVHQVKHLGAFGVVARVKDLVTGWPAFGLDLQLAAFALDPMLSGAIEGRIYDQGHIDLHLERHDLERFDPAVVQNLDRYAPVLSRLKWQ